MESKDLDLDIYINPDELACVFCGEGKGVCICSLDEYEKCSS